MNTVLILGIFTILTHQFQRFSYAQECPTFSRQIMPRFYDGYVISNYLQIPNTNILLVNSIYSENNKAVSSIVFYNDISKQIDNIINAIKPSYVINQMEYIQQRNQILALNQQGIIFADPYTLESIQSFTYSRLVSMSLLNGSKYALLQSYLYVLYIIDIVSGEQIFTLDVSSYNSNPYNYIAIAKFFSLQNGQQFIVVLDVYGAYTWSLNLINVYSTYNGYFAKSDQTSVTYNLVDLHSNYDIMFLATSYYGMNAYQIIDLQKNQINILQGYYVQRGSQENSFISLQSIIMDNQQTSLFLTDKYNIFRLDLNIQYNQSTNTYDVFDFVNINQPFIVQTGEQYKSWYHLKCKNQFLIPYFTSFFYQTGTLVYSYNTNQSYIRSTFPSSGYTKIFGFELDQQQYFVVPQLNRILITKDSPNNDVSQVFIMKRNIEVRQNTFFQVKNCDNCFVLMQENQYISINQVLNDTFSIIEFDLSQLSLNINKISTNIDPYQDNNNKFWVVVGLPQKENNENFLFYAICINDNTYQQLYSNDPIDNTLSSSFALYSTIDQEIIGIDLRGYIYGWDAKDFSFKYKKTPQYSCQNSNIGQLYQKDNQKFLIIVCSDFNAISYNFNTGETVVLTKLSSNPFTINVFDSIDMIGIGDQSNGEVYLWYLNSKTSNFSLFMNFQTPQYTDVINNLQYIKQNKTLFIQYYYGNLLLPIGQCLSNVTSCLSCQMSFYFNTSEINGQLNMYGQGTLSNPYTSSLSIIQAFLMVQQYFQLIKNVINVQAYIHINSENKMTFYNRLLTLEAFQKTNLFIQSWDQEKQAQINVSGQLQFSGLELLNLDNLLLQFTIDANASQQCGIQFQNILEKVFIDNIQITSSNQAINCFTIQINQSDVILQNISLKNKDFSNVSSLITIQNSQKVSFNNFSIESCTLNQNFSILTQISDVQVLIDTVIIQNNVCDTSKVYYPQFSGQLFKAGQYNVTNLIATGNQFCNLKVFSTVSNIQQQDIKFQFQDIVLMNNQFYISSTYLLFNAIYSINPIPQHHLTMKNLTFSDNKYFPSSQVSSDIYLGITQFVLTEKILSVSITDVKVENHQEIGFCSISQSSLISLNYISCRNNKSFYDSVKNREYGGCLLFREVKEFNLLSLQSEYLKGFNNLILAINNQIYTNSIIQIKKVNITKSYFEQNQTNSPANPILINSIYYSNVTIQDSIFSENQLIGIFNPQQFSTTGIQILNPLGIIILNNNQFFNSKSNSLFNYQYLVGMNIDISNNIFQNSSFDLNDASASFVQQGGCLRAKTTNLNILSSNFSQSTANIGSFIYLESLSSQLNLNVENSQFNEGYSYQDGGAFYIETSHSKLNFLCNQCNFSNIYTLSPQSSTISIAIQNTTFNETYPDYINQIVSVFDIQSVTLIQAQLSNLQIINCDFDNLIIKNLEQHTPLLINTTNTDVILQNLKIQNSFFSTQLISVNQGTLNILQSKFFNLSQITSKRMLQDQNSQVYLGSLIMLSNSTLIIGQETLFQLIKCPNCCGSVLQLQQTQFQIFNTQFLKSQAKYGGAISIQGLVSNQNKIKSSTLVQNTAVNDGGALYLLALKSDIFTLELNNCTIQDNKSLQGNGGALYIRSQSSSSSLQIINILNSTLTGNKANVGGCIDNQVINPSIDQLTTLQNNQAVLYGDNINSYPSHLNFIVTDELIPYYNQSTNHLTFQKIKSGQSIPKLAFQLRDQTQKPIFPLDSQNINVFVQFSLKTKNYSNYYIRGNNTATFDFKNKYFIFDGIQLIGTPNSQAIIEFKSDAIQILNSQTNQYESNYSYEVEVYFRNCSYGEIQNSYNTYTECVVCEQDKYSLDSKQCYQCPSGAKCKNGIIFVNEGYWRKQENSSLVIECVNKDQNCVGNNYGNYACQVGYIGPLCEECDIHGDFWGQSYSKVGSYECGQCKDLSSYLWKVILAVTWTLFSIQLAIRGDLEEQAIIAVQGIFKRHSTRFQSKPSSDKSQFQKKKTIQWNQQKYQSSQDQEKASVYIKVFTNYLQIIGSIISFNIKYATNIFDTSQYLGTPVRQQMNSLDCTLKEIQTDIPLIYLRFLFSLLVPVAYFLTFLLGLVLQRVFTKDKIHIYSMSTALIFIFILVQPDLVSQMVAILSCRQIGDQEYILFNVSYECNTTQHLRYSQYLIVPSLLFFAFIIPILLFYILYRNRKNLLTIKVNKQYGFLYREYRTEKYYWEFIKMLEKIFIILILNFYSQEINVKGVLIFAIITLYGIYSNILQPYNLNGYNMIDFYQTNVCAISVLLCLFINNNPFNYFVISSIIILAIINIWFIIIVIHRVIRGYLIQIKDKLLELSQKFSFTKRIVQKFYKKPINPELKAKIRRILLEYLKLRQEQKWDLLLIGLKKQIERNNQRLFNEQSIKPTESQNKLQKYESKFEPEQDIEIDIDNDIEMIPQTTFSPHQSKTCLAKGKFIKKNKKFYIKLFKIFRKQQAKQSNLQQTYKLRIIFKRNSQIEVFSQRKSRQQFNSFYLKQQ
ncbi:transmembrane protein, putative (macronuclear) [Tetrahymena thermophila SB210]|uniref:Transmembrane protein, putative n=1 Tax=Tetrahymena thermophila (strain SB210) TaxID=312017 RepID=Q23F01_TETTS|nr:transmembrane protein, putative [Tetrahymena thermophila SB210]EAR95104.2 transmembrane protein, putative [Tetrahymena thermophila SB210]|eukprot:XP_001015349.2 transmembrane protein, putative [Tetrahymena thermophila SB210]